MAARLKLVLNVDDQAPNRYIRAHALQRAGFRVVDADSGAAALEAAARGLPDVVLLDVNLPDLSGYQVCSRLKARPDAPPVLMISAILLDAASRARGLECGADGFVEDFIEPEVLVAHVRALARVSESERLARALNRIHAGIASTIKFDEIVPRVMIDGKSAIGADSAALIMADETGLRVTHAQGVHGLEGVRIAPAANSPLLAELRGGRSLTFEGAEQPLGLAEAHGFRSMLIVPLIVQASLLGAVSFHHHAAAFSFTPAEIDFANSLGSALSLALHNAQLFTAAEEGRKTLEALLEYVPEGITIAEAPDVNIVTVSRHGAELTGRPRRQLVGIPADQHPANWRMLRPDGSLAPADELPLTRATRHGEVITGEEFMLERADGSRVTILCNAGPIRNSAGEITGGVSAWRDITESKRLQEQLGEARKMKAVGLLAGGIAHEFNNMLTVIGGRTELLKESVKTSRAKQDLDAVISAAARLALLTSQLLAYAGKQMVHRQSIDLNAIIERQRKALEYLLGDAIPLRTSLAPQVWTVNVDPGQIAQMIVSLAMNAREGMPAGGSLEIGTENVSFRARQGLPSEHLRPGDYVRLSMADTGPGLDPETLRRIFEPFYTTKGFGGGTLGLSTVFGIARQNGGDIRVESQPGKGTRFDIYLPRQEDNGTPLM